MTVLKFSSNLTLIAAMALCTILAACSNNQSGDASTTETAIAKKLPPVESDATSGIDFTLNSVNSANKPNIPAPHDFVIVMLGDSLTAGFGLASADAPPAQLEERLKAKGFSATVINAGVSGDTTAGGLARFAWSVAGAEPDLLVVALGANDYLGSVTPTRAKENLDRIIERAKEAGIPVVLVGLEPRSSATADSRGTDYDTIYPTLAATHGTPLYPEMLKGVRDDPSLLQADGLHPTAEGVGIIVDNFAEFLSPIIANMFE